MFSICANDPQKNSSKNLVAEFRKAYKTQTLTKQNGNCLKLSSYPKYFM